MFTPDALPAPPEAVLGQVRTWCGDDAREQLHGVGAESRAAWVAGLQQLADAVAAASLTAVEVFDTAGDGQMLHGAASTAAWLRGATRLTGAEAAERVRIARLSRGLLAGPVTEVRDGGLTYQHLRAADRGVRHLQVVVDPDGSLADHQQQFDHRYLTLSPLMDGMTALDGLLDAESPPCSPPPSNRSWSPQAPTTPAPTPSAALTA